MVAVDHAHVDRDRRVAAHRQDHAVLQDAQQTHLQLRRQLADLVEEDGAAVRAAEEPRAVGDRTGERAAHVTEELALDQVLRDRAAVHDHERAVRARAAPVDGARDQLLAGAALAGHQHRRVGVRDLVDQLRDRAHRGTAADDAVALVLAHLVRLGEVVDRAVVADHQGRVLVLREALLELLDARDVLQEDDLADPVGVGVEQRACA